jgi:hypothetical protein
MIRRLHGERDPEEVSQEKVLSNFERFQTKLQINR